VLGFAACRAGTIPNSRPAAREIARVKVRALASRPMEKSHGPSMGMLTPARILRDRWASPRPAAPPRTLKTRLSVRSCRTMRPRLAPMLSRIPISRRRSRARARKRLATLTQAMSRSNATTTIITALIPTWAFLNTGWIPASFCRTRVCPNWVSY